MSEFDHAEYMLKADAVLNFIWGTRFDNSTPTGLVSAQDVRKALVISVLYAKGGELISDNIAAIEKAYKDHWGNRSDGKSPASINFSVN